MRGTGSGSSARAASDQPARRTGFRPTSRQSAETPQQRPLRQSYVPRSTQPVRVLAIDPLRVIVDQHGVFLRREATQLGLPDKVIARAVRGGVITRVRHGCYTFTDIWEGLGPTDRHLLAGRAVMRRVGNVALSHTTGALAHGLHVWGADLSRVHVTRTDGAAGRTDDDVVHHEGFVARGELTTAHGVGVVPPVRAALETALLSGVESGLVTVCSGLRNGAFTMADLARQHDVMAAWPGAQPLQIVTRLADGGYESVGEVRSAYLFWTSGIPCPVPQHEVHDEHGRLIGRVDFAWPSHRLVVEFDGAEKYQRYLRPGESPGDAVFREKRREDALRAAGWTVVRLTWSDLERPRDVVERIRRALRMR